MQKVEKSKCLVMKGTLRPKHKGRIYTKLENDAIDGTFGSAYDIHSQLPKNDRRDLCKSPKG